MSWSVVVIASSINQSGGGASVVVETIPGFNDKNTAEAAAQKITAVRDLYSTNVRAVAVEM